MLKLKASKKTKKTPAGEIPVDWASTSIGQIAKIISGGTPSRGNGEFWGGAVPWIKTGAINFSTIKEADEWITQKGLEESAARIIPCGTILMAMYGQGKTRGQVAVLGIDAAINQACAAILINDEVNRDFVFQQLIFRYAEIRRLSNTGNQENLNANLIRGIALALPPIAEQRKIAEILGAWDRAIEVLQALLDAKNRRLRGLRQQLLTGALRHPKFTKKPWIKVRLGELLKHIFRPVEWAPDRLFKLVSIRRRSGGLFRREDLLGSEYKTTDMHELQAGDFLVSKRQVCHGAWGMVADAFAGTHVSKEYSIFVNKAPKVLYTPFLDWLSRLPLMWHYAFLSSNGVHREKLIFEPKDFLRFHIDVPPTLEEQETIIRILNACEQEIQLTQRELEARRTQKRGLMQKLLTGQVRVKV
ncbi:MAG: restriction endonuclease subunit S [Verrucomicrobiota bacterium]